MHLTRFSDNALRCLTFLALAPQTSATTASIAASMALSEGHLMKVVQRLAALGFIETTRGRGGGIRLARPPEAIRIGTVIRATEESFRLVECFDPETNQCPIAPACVLAGVLDEALAAFLAVLDRVTLADLAVRPTQLRRLLRA
ncbi:MAG: Rrf2 family transcriptional regulator [Gemmatimonadaceae bacterium]|nr:Rrf2 family transcriptional regulator [Gemmatimonadaceae bacterium]